MARSSVSGMKEYIAQIEFSLNFEERDKSGKQVSAKVKVKDKVLYDGIIAKFKKPNGEEVVGRTSSLNSAIASNWLCLAGTKPGPLNVRVETTPNIKTQGTYDAKSGGDFDKFISQEFKPTKEVIREEDRVVKKTSKMEVSADQREVKATVVSSSTAVSATKGRGKVSVKMAEDYGAEHSVSVASRKKEESATSKKKTFTVDGRTPRISDDATMAEVQRMTVKHIDESQDARVVRKGPKAKLEVEEQDGRVVSKTKPVPVVEESIIFNKDGSKEKKDVEFSSGSTPVADLTEAKTQEDVVAIEKSISKKASASANFLSMLPENWADLHWVKKEKFIMSLTDKEFLKFLLNVENTRAVQLACKKRLAELAKLG